MPIGLNGGGHEVQAVKRFGGVGELFVNESPLRRPHSPEEIAGLSAIVRQPETASFGLEMPLVPELKFLHGGLRSRSGFCDVLDRVTARYQSPNPFRPESRRDAGSAASPVVPNQDGSFNIQSIEKVDNVSSQRSLLSAAKDVVREIW